MLVLLGDGWRIGRDAEAILGCGGEVEDIEPDFGRLAIAAAAFKRSCSDFGPSADRDKGGSVA